jgi:alkanesulfonate monooxygenase SsuD/methylene tetrahydromethanopterin reductase-like flavin-dependent oxidoreductase (luciferase family)
MNSGRVGLRTASLDGGTAGDLPRLAVDVDEQGWWSFWFGAAYGREAFTAAADLLPSRIRLRVGTGIAGIYCRDAVACAAAARMLHAVHQGRFVPGLGVSRAPLVERTRGHRHGQPLQEMRACLKAVRAATTVVTDEQELPPIVAAALGPRMPELAGENAQGAIQYVKRQGFDDVGLVRGGGAALKRAMVPLGLAAALSRIAEHLVAGVSQVIVQVAGPETLSPALPDWPLLARALR